jgi:gas vesicle protein
LPLSNSNQSSPNGSMIGGIVGGVAAIILVSSFVF